MDKISVCLTTYNSEKYIIPQLCSILKQLNHGDEVIISDDNSMDKTKEIILSLNDQRIKFIINDNDRGYTSNFENAIKNSSGDIIILSDHDDIWCDDKVETILAKLCEYDFFVSDCTIIDEHGELIADSFYQIRKPKITFWGNIIKFGYLGCCMAFRRDILQKALPFPRKKELCTHDNWLFIVSKAFYRVYISNKKLTKYRRHGKNNSNGGFVQNKSIFFKIKYRLYLLVMLTIRYFRTT